MYGHVNVKSQYIISYSAHHDIHLLERSIVARSHNVYTSSAILTA